MSDGKRNDDNKRVKRYPVPHTRYETALLTFHISTTAAGAVGERAFYNVSSGALPAIDHVKVVQRHRLVTDTGMSMLDRVRYL